MKTEWLVEQCTSTDPRAIRLKEMAALELSEANKNKLLERSKEFRAWVETKWIPFISEMSPGDELWRFRSPPGSWDRLCGAAGYSIVRDGTIVTLLVTLRN